jgi:hypothetical protein
VTGTDENVEVFEESGVCSLQIRQMTHELQGYFACKVLNADGYVIIESGCFVSVEEENSDEVAVTRSASKLSLFTVLPSFVVDLKKTTVVREGARLELACQLNTNCEPRPAILWFRDGQLLKPGQGIGVTQSYRAETGECRFVVKSSERFLNQGIYVCTAAVQSGSEHFDYICKTMTNVKVGDNN